MHEVTVDRIADGCVHEQCVDAVRLRNSRVRVQELNGMIEREQAGDGKAVTRTAPRSFSRPP